ncbi:MAG: acyltransferase family protein [Cytophagales bacterium]|nr:acyltransferase family protein [Cytophagales bacterium]
MGIYILLILLKRLIGGKLHYLIYDVTFKWGTAVFLMISGAFMLSPRKSENIGSFIWSRFQRIIIPFIIWAVIYKYSYGEGIYNSFSLDSFVTLLKDLLIGNVHYHLWFVYMIFVLYLITPILSSFVNNASKKTLYYYFGLWFILTVFPSLIKFIWGIDTGFNNYFHLHNYVGFYVLGYFLHKNEIKLPLYVYLIIPLMIVLNFFTTRWLSVELGKTEFFFLSRFSFFNVVNAVLVFNLFRQLPWESWIKSSKVRSTISTISLLSYGVFLMHVLFIWILSQGHIPCLKINAYMINGKWIQLKASLQLYAGFSLIITIVTITSFVLSYIISKIPFVKKLLI